MDNTRARRIVYSVFSDTLMVFLALLILPIVLVQYLLDLTSTQNVILSVISWIIYLLFVLEFILKILVADKKTHFIKSNKLYTFISLVIIISPILEPVSVIFAAAPFLRAVGIVNITRVSRLTTVLAVSGRAKLSWKKLNFRTYAIVTSVIVFGFLLSFFKPQIHISNIDQSLLAQFLQITATIYAIINGFVIANVWNKYISLVRSVNSEATALRNVYLIAILLKNPLLLLKLKKALTTYIETVIDVYWTGKSHEDAIEQASGKIYGTLDTDLQTSREVEIYTNLIDEFRRSTEGQVGIKSLLASKTPKILWVLISVLSSILFFGLYLTNYDNQFFASLTLTLVSTAVALVAVIIYDMNEPFKLGFWAVSPVAYLNLLGFLDTTPKNDVS